MSFIVFKIYYVELIDCVVMQTLLRAVNQTAECMYVCLTERWLHGAETRCVSRLAPHPCRSTAPTGWCCTPGPCNSLSLTHCSTVNHAYRAVYLIQGDGYGACKSSHPNYRAPFRLNKEAWCSSVLFISVIFRNNVGDYVNFTFCVFVILLTIFQ